jgi:hypothetical protein
MVLMVLAPLLPMSGPEKFPCVDLPLSNVGMSLAWAMDAVCSCCTTVAQMETCEIIVDDFPKQ